MHRSLPNRLFHSVIALGLPLLFSVTGLAQAPAPPVAPPPAAPAMLEGVDHWDWYQFQEFMKKTYQLDIPAGPPTFPNSAMLNDVNPEFANRVRAVVAAFHAFGGTDIGIAPNTGGLRTVEMQKALYKKGRQIRQDGNRANGAVRDGTLQEDWVRRTDNDLGHDLYIEVPEVVTNPVTKRKSTRNRRVRIGFAGEQIGRNADGTPRYGTVTDAWGPSGWHAYGLAVDFAWFPNGVYNNGDTPFRTDAWNKTVLVAAQLGLRPGIWFRPRPDTPHFEYHPGLPDSPANIPGIANGTAQLAGAAVTPGTVITPAQLQIDYRWKLPSKIYIWNRNVENDKLGEILYCYEFELKDGWICLKRFREISRTPRLGWQGQWITYSPPARLFHTYTPTQVTSREPDVYDMDRQWKGSTELVISNYHEVLADGKIAKGHGEIKGVYPTAVRVTLTDHFIGAWTQLWGHTQTAAEQRRYAALRKDRYYEVLIHLPSDFAVPAGNVTSKTRDVDIEGYTSDFARTEKGRVNGFVTFAITWKRATGEIGVGSIHAVDGNLPIELKPLRCADNGQCHTVSATLPQGAFDCEQPPAWTAPNPRPMQ